MEQTVTQFDPDPSNIQYSYLDPEPGDFQAMDPESGSKALIYPLRPALEQNKDEFCTGAV